MGIVVIGDVFIDIKGYSTSPYIPQGRNAGTIVQIHGGVGRNVVEDIANVELEPTFVGAVDNDAMGEEVIQKLKRPGWQYLIMKVMWLHPFQRDQIIERLKEFWMNMAMRSLRMQTVS